MARGLGRVRSRREPLLSRHTRIDRGTRSCDGQFLDHAPFRLPRIGPARDPVRAHRVSHSPLPAPGARPYLQTRLADAMDRPDHNADSYTQSGCPAHRACLGIPESVAGIDSAGCAAGAGPPGPRGQVVWGTPARAWCGLGFGLREFDEDRVGAGGSHRHARVFLRVDSARLVEGYFHLDLVVPGRQAPPESDRVSITESGCCAVWCGPGAFRGAPRPEPGHCPGSPETDRGCSAPGPTRPVQPSRCCASLASAVRLSALCRPSPFSERPTVA